MRLALAGTWNLALGRAPRMLFIVSIRDVVCAEHLLFFGDLESWHGVNRVPV